MKAKLERERVEYLAMMARESEEEAENARALQAKIEYRSEARRKMAALESARQRQRNEERERKSYERQLVNAEHEKEERRLKILEKKRLEAQAQFRRDLALQLLQKQQHALSERMGGYQQPTCIVQEPSSDKATSRAIGMTGDNPVTTSSTSHMHGSLSNDNASTLNPREHTNMEVIPHRQPRKHLRDDANAFIDVNDRFIKQKLRQHLFSLGNSTLSNQSTNPSSMITSTTAKSTAVAMLSPPIRQQQQQQQHPYYKPPAAMSSAHETAALEMRTPAFGGVGLQDDVYICVCMYIWIVIEMDE